MIALVLCALVVAAAAAPQYFPAYRHQPFYPDHRMQHASPYFNDNVFDMGSFWADLNKELRQMDVMLAEISRRFPTRACNEGVEGNEYKINIPLDGFDDKDIVVKAREGVLMVQAIHKMAEDVEKSYVDIRTLPAYVSPKGDWKYEDGVLKIVFPLKASAVTEVPVTQAPTESREEVDDAKDEKDADVGLEKTETEDKEILTNEIPRNSIEATTYAVDLKDEYEFVPVKY